MSISPRPDPPSHEPDPERLADLLSDQSGVIARRQALECGFGAADIRRRLRRKEWARIREGIYVDHTGPLTWTQRAWAAVLESWPAALAGASAWRAAGGPGWSGEEAPITIAVDRQRHLKPGPGVVVRRTTRLPVRVLWNTSPPRMRFEDVTIDLAAKEDSETAAIAWLADAVQARLTTAERLLESVKARPWLEHRSFIGRVLGDVRDGTCSVLEHAYLSRVEQAHGLPTPERQAPTGTGRPGFRDVDYPSYGVIVELDGRLGHTRARDRDRDLQRDLDAAVGRGAVTARLGWGQVYDRPCETAAKIAALLSRHGWTGTPTSCQRCM